MLLLLKKLYVGTIVAIKIDGIPMFSSPNKEIATGSPKVQKLLLKIHLNYNSSSFIFFFK